MGYGFAQVNLARRAQWGQLIENYLTTRETLRMGLCAESENRDGNDLLQWAEMTKVGVPLVMFPAVGLQTIHEIVLAADTHTSSWRPPLLPQPTVLVGFPCHPAQTFVCGLVETPVMVVVAGVVQLFALTKVDEPTTAP